MDYSWEFCWKWIIWEKKYNKDNSKCWKYLIGLIFYMYKCLLLKLNVLLAIIWKSNFLCNSKHFLLPWFPLLWFLFAPRIYASNCKSSHKILSTKIMLIERDHPGGIMVPSTENLLVPSWTPVYLAVAPHKEPHTHTAHLSIFTVIKQSEKSNLLGKKSGNNTVSV